MVTSTTAEDMVAAMLEADAWRIVARNYRGPGFELDLLTYRDGILAIVEVKARRTYPRSGIDAAGLLPRRKVVALSRGIHHWLARYHSLLNPKVIRLDLALVRTSPPVGIRLHRDVAPLEGLHQ